MFRYLMEPDFSLTRYYSVGRVIAMLQEEVERELQGIPGIAVSSNDDLFLEIVSAEDIFERLKIFGRQFFEAGDGIFTFKEAGAHKMEEYVLEVGSLRYPIKADNDEQARTKAKKIVASLGALYADAILYYARTVERFPATCKMEEMPEWEDFLKRCKESRSHTPENRQ